MDSPTNAPAITVKHVGKSFHNLSLLTDVSFDVAAGEAIAIVGASGAGKTTLLKCINLLTPIDKGFISLGDQIIQNVDPDTGLRFIVEQPNIVRQRVGMIFQEWNLWPNMTVRQNITEGPLTVLRKNRQEVSSLADRLAAQVSISDKLDLYPHQLSGGQKQRAAIARAFGRRSHHK